MNDNYNDNNYADGYWPLEITINGPRSYSLCIGAGSFFHNLSIVFTNNISGKRGRTPILHKERVIEYTIV